MLSWCFKTCKQSLSTPFVPNFDLDQECQCCKTVFRHFDWHVRKFWSGKTCIWGWLYLGWVSTQSLKKLCAEIQYPKKNIVWPRKCIQTIWDPGRLNQSPTHHGRSVSFREAGLVHHWHAKVSTHGFQMTWTRERAEITTEISRQRKASEFCRIFLSAVMSVQTLCCLLHIFVFL